MLPEAWQAVRRVLVVRLDNIGDVVMCGPVLRTLRQALPGAHIALMVSPAGSQAAPLLKEVDEVIVARAVWQDASGAMALDPAHEEALIARLRAGRFDAAVILTSFSQSPYPPAYACYLAGIPIRLGQSKEFGGSVLSQAVGALPDSAHQVDRNLFLLECAGFEPAGRQLALTVPPEPGVRAARLLAAHGINPETPFIALAPGASCPARRYPSGRYAEVARILARETGAPVVWLGSERDQDLVPVGAAGEGSLSLVGRTSVVELAAVIARARLVVANDSGPMHIADAFCRPLVVLYSGTELESQWQPRTAPVRLLRQPTDCSPCYRFECPYDLECLAITPEAVARAAFELLTSEVPVGHSK